MKSTETKPSIPEISDERLLELYDRIKPVIRGKDDLLYDIAPVDLRKVAFNWSPTLLEPVGKLEIVAKIRTLHTYGYYGFFKPSIAEVLAQIPESLIESVDFFEVTGPDDIHDLHRESEALNAGFHVARTTLYRKLSN